MDRPIRIAVRDTGHAGGGYAAIRIEPVTEFEGEGSFQIQRFDSPERFLGPTGWQVSDVWLKPDRAAVAGNVMTLEVGPAIVDEIAYGQAIELRVVCGGLTYFGTLNWPDIAASVAGGAGNRSIGTSGPPKKPTRTADLSGQRVAAALAPPPAVVPPAELVAERPTPAAPPPPKPKWPWIASGLLLLALIIGLGALSWTCPSFWSYCRLRDMKPQIEAWLHLSPPSPLPPPSTVPPRAPAPAPSPTPAALDCKAEKLITEAETVQRLYEEAERCGSQSNWDGAVGALEEAAARHYGPAAAALAALYDPVVFQPGKVFSSADPFQAAKYYKMAVELGDNDAIAPREALRQWLLSRSQTGDAMAKLNLKDNWPGQP